MPGDLESFLLVQFRQKEALQGCVSTNLPDCGLIGADSRRRNGGELLITLSFYYSHPSLVLGGGGWREGRQLIQLVLNNVKF